jgi:hypothetical protein
MLQNYHGFDSKRSHVLQRFVEEKKVLDKILFSREYWRQIIASESGKGTSKESIKERFCSLLRHCMKRAMVCPKAKPFNSLLVVPRQKFKPPIPPKENDGKDKVIPVLNQVPRREEIWQSGGIAPRILSSQFHVPAALIGYTLV